MENIKLKKNQVKKKKGIIQMHTHNSGLKNQARNTTA